MPYGSLSFYKISNLYMKFMNKITKTRYSFMYLMKNEKNTSESPKFGNGHIQLIRMESPLGKYGLKFGLGNPTSSCGENNFFVKIFCQNKAEKQKLP